jgi:hypothetical protein
MPAYIKDLMSGEVVKTRAKKGRSNAIRLFVEKEIMAGQEMLLMKQHNSRQQRENH